MRVISGVQPSGALHLGNYFGAIREHIAWQNKAESYFLIADLHALTTQHDGSRLRKNATQAAMIYLACGLDPEKATLYRQSDVPEVCELSWILNTITPMGLLERAVAYKEARQRQQNVDAGLFNYPILMAADILMLGATLVLVGRDQLQHVEIARDIAQRFNSLYQRQEPIFALPQAQLSSTPYVPGINGEKMSKRYGNTVEILDEGIELQTKVNAIVTDSKRRNEPKNPDTCTIFTLLSLLLPENETRLLAERYRSGGIDYSEAKKMLAEQLDMHFREIRQKYHELQASPAFTEKALMDGAARARSKVQETLTAVRQIVGLGQR